MKLILRRKVVRSFSNVHSQTCYVYIAMWLSFFDNIQVTLLLVCVVSKCPADYIKAIILLYWFSIRRVNLCKCIGLVPCGLHQFSTYFLLSVWEPWQNVLDGLQGTPSITGWWRWIHPLPVLSISVPYIALPCTEAVRMVVEAAKPGVSVLSLCEKGDAFIAAETSKVFKKEKDIKKGTRVKYGQICFLGDRLVNCINYLECEDYNFVLFFFRYCFPYLCVCQQLCVPLLSSEEWSWLHAERWRSC